MLEHVGVPNQDEVRAVFGPIPPIDVTDIGNRSRPDGFTTETATLFVEVDGNSMCIGERMQNRRLNIGSVLTVKPTCVA